MDINVSIIDQRVRKLAEDLAGEFADSRHPDTCDNCKEKFE